MKKFLLILIVFFASAHCFSQNDEFIKDINVEGEPVVVNGVKFNRYWYETKDIKKKTFSKTIDFTLPLLDDETIMYKIWDELLLGEYDSRELGQQMREEQVAQTEEIVEALENGNLSDSNYYETVWKIVPVFVGGGYVAFVSSFSQKFASDIPAPMWGDVGSVYELSTGKRITEEDVFGKNVEQNKAVAKKLYAELKKKASAENTEDVDLFNGNFYFTNKELVFMYGSFAMYHTSGVTKLSLPKKSVKPYLNVDGPLYKYWFGEKK